MANTIFLALFPAVFGVALGWIAVRMGYLKRDYAPAFGAFVIKVALPFALLAGVIQMPLKEMPSSGYTLCLVAGFVGSISSRWHWEDHCSKTIWLPARCRDFYAHFPAWHSPVCPFFPALSALV